MTDFEDLPVSDSERARIEVLRRKIAALEALAADPGTSAPESESAQTTANKLRLELARLLRSVAAQGEPVPNSSEVGDGFVGARADDTPASSHAAPASGASPGANAAASQGPPSTGSSPRAAAPPSARAASSRGARPRRAPVSSEPVLPVWLQRTAVTLALGAVLLGFYTWPADEPEPVESRFVDPPSALAADEALAQAASASPDSPAPLPTPVMPVLPPPSPRGEARAAGAGRERYCRRAEAQLRQASTRLLGRAQDGVELTSAHVDGCNARFEVRLSNVSKDEVAKAGGLRHPAVSTELTAALCADDASRAALVEHEASYTFAYYDRAGSPITELIIDGVSCTPRATAPKL